MTAAFPDQPRDVLLGVAEFLERLIAHRLLDGIEVGALHVLDDRKLERLAIARLEKNDRNVVHAGALRRAPAPLARDDLVMIGRAAQGSHHDRLDDAALADRRCELVELDLGIGLTRVAGIGLEKLDRDAALSARPFDDGGLLAYVADQRREAAPQSRSRRFLRHLRLPSIRNRANLCARIRRRYAELF